MFSLSTFLHFEIRSSTTPYPVSSASQARSVLSGQQSARGHWLVCWFVGLIWTRLLFLSSLSPSLSLPSLPTQTPLWWPNYQVGLIGSILSELSLSLLRRWFWPEPDGGSQWGRGAGPGHGDPQRPRSHRGCGGQQVGRSGGRMSTGRLTGKNC